MRLALGCVVAVTLFTACKKKDRDERPLATEGTREAVPPPAPAGNPRNPPARTEPDPVGGPAATVCYPGALDDGTACFDTWELADDASGYDYPAPFQDSPQYLAPARFLDLNEIDGATRVAPNFRLDELATVSRSRYAIVQSHAVERLQAMRDEVGAIGVNSGYRSPGYNASIPGSATWSRHQYGDGFDLDPSAVSLRALAEACEAEGAGYVEVYVSHVHCDWRDDPLDTAFFDGLRSVAFSVTPARDSAIVWSGSALRAPAIGFDEGEPLREWIAYDSDGTVLIRETGPRFVPPIATSTVEVTVGRVVTRMVSLGER